MTRKLLVIGAAVVAAVAVDAVLFLAAVEHFDGDYDFGL